MAITLDGTNGITTPEIISTAGPVVIDASAANNSLVVTANGNVGIGTSSPAVRLSITDAGNVNKIFLSGVGITNNTEQSSIKFGDLNNAINSEISSYRGASFERGELTFKTAFGGVLNERMRIDSAGNVGIGQTPGRKLDVTGIIRSDGASGAFALGGDSTTPAEGAAIHRPAADTLAFVTASTERMRIGSTGAVTIANLAGAGSRTVTAGSGGVLAAASDSRLKQEVPTAPIPGLAEIMRLEPRAYKWLDDIENRGEDASVEIGFFANEVKDIIPSAAPMGNDGYYGFYDRAVIAALTKAVQEQQVLITALTARIEALETTQ